ncbi:MAG: nucleotide exchange factor GrpE [Gammaproteobacteria bacterium]|nr:nucleotide exchange factor GrpE [Gammaproteobacteria bacterium]
MTEENPRDTNSQQAAAAEGGNGNEPVQDPAPQAAGSGSRDNELEALRRQAEDNWGQYLRAVAELDNLRKRNARELENARKYGAEKLAQALLPVRDSIEAALGSADTVDVATLLEGERATLRLLDEALSLAGIREIDPQGEAFDPNKHEAMTLQQTADVAPDCVVTVIQKGYELNDRLLRPARVVVAAAPAESRSSGSQE